MTAATVCPGETTTISGLQNFVMRLFDTFAKDYRMLAYPELRCYARKQQQRTVLPTTTASSGSRNRCRRQPLKSRPIRDNDNQL